MTSTHAAEPSAILEARIQRAPDGTPLGAAVWLPADWLEGMVKPGADSIAIVRDPETQGLRIRAGTAAGPSPG